MMGAERMLADMMDAERATWEYRVEYMGADADDVGNLNVLGAQGWEAVSFTGYLVLLKRHVTPAETLDVFQGSAHCEDVCMENCIGACGV